MHGTRAGYPRLCLSLVADAGHRCRRWLLGLLILQSISSVVLDSYQDLLKEHIVVTFFLTMLVRRTLTPTLTMTLTLTLTLSMLWRLHACLTVTVLPLQARGRGI